jgi:hypothetical protein
MNATEWKATQGKMEAVAEHQEVSNEEAKVETVEAFKDRSRDQPAIGYQNPLKRWTQDDVVRGSPKRLMSAKIRWTRPECNDGVRG